MIGQTDLLHPSPAPHFKTFKVFSDLLSEVSKFQHHTKPRSKLREINKIEDTVFMNFLSCSANCKLTT